MRFARASSCCVLRNKNAGSGLTLNGFWVKQKKALYILTGGHGRDPNQGLLASYHARERVQTAERLSAYGTRRAKPRTLSKTRRDPRISASSSASQRLRVKHFSLACRRMSGGGRLLVFLAFFGLFVLIATLAGRFHGADQHVSVTAFQ